MGHWGGNEYRGKRVDLIIEMRPIVLRHTLVDPVVHPVGEAGRNLADKRG